MKTLILLQIVIIDAWSNHLPCTTKLPLQPGDGRQRCLEHLIDGLKRNLNLQRLNGYSESRQRNSIECRCTRRSWKIQSKLLNPMFKRGYASRAPMLHRSNPEVDIGKLTLFLANLIEVQAFASTPANGSSPITVGKTLNNPYGTSGWATTQCAV